MLWVSIFVLRLRGYYTLAFFDIAQIKTMNVQVRLNMPTQGKKCNGLEQREAVVKYRIREMLQHPQDSRKKSKADAASRPRKH